MIILEFSFNGTAFESILTLYGIAQLSLFYHLFIMSFPEFKYNDLKCQPLTSKNYMNLCLRFYFLNKHSKRRIMKQFMQQKHTAFNPNYCNKNAYTIAHTKICSVKFNSKGSLFLRHLCTQQRIKLPLDDARIHLHT